MRRALVPHPDHPCRSASGIEVLLGRPRPTALSLQFRVTGRIGDLLMPPPADPVRADDLWQHSCFEAFVRLPGEGYDEFNFAPSGQWAAYRFGGYRSRRSDIPLAPPAIETKSSADRYELRAEVDGLPDGPWQLGLSVILEEVDGCKSYWALAHPPGKADFHHPDSFALQVPAPSP